MKKILIFTAAVLFSAVTLSARPTGFNIGGGINYLGWTPNPKPANSDYVGPYVEVGYDLKVANNSYIYFGGRIDTGFSVVDAKSSKYASAVYTYSICDLFIPIRFQQNFNVGPKTSLYVEAGPAAGFLLFNDYTFFAVGSEGSTDAIVRDSGSIINNNTPRANFYLGGNFGVNIRKHVKIYAGGDYGFAKFQYGTVSTNRWQLNFGAAYVF